MIIETYNCRSLPTLQDYMNCIKKLILISTIAVNTAFSQSWEAGGMVGLTGYYGDVNNEIFANASTFKQMRGGIFGFVRYHAAERLAIRANVGYLRIAGIDSFSSSKWQVARNLNFYTDMLEASLQFELNLLQDRSKGKRIVNRTIPYIFGGIGFTYFTPKTFYRGREFNLAELNTSGIDYSQTTYNIPIGFGLRTYLSPNWILGFEAGVRLTGTSWLDDINGTQSRYPNPNSLGSQDARIAYDRSSKNPPDMPPGSVPGTWGIPGRQRGKIDGNDMYYIIGVTMSYKFGNLTSRRFQGKVMRCPRFY